MVRSETQRRDRIAELRNLVWMRTSVVTGRAGSIRRAANVSQAEVARALGCNPAAVSLWETGRRVPRGDLGRRYADLLAQLAAQGGPPQ